MLQCFHWLWGEGGEHWTLRGGGDWQLCDPFWALLFLPPSQRSVCSGGKAVHSQGMPPGLCHLGSTWDPCRAASALRNQLWAQAVLALIWCVQFQLHVWAGGGHRLQPRGRGADADDEPAGDRGQHGALQGHSGWPRQGEGRGGHTPVLGGWPGASTTLMGAVGSYSDTACHQ